MAQATDLIRYDLLVQDALRGVVRRVLSDAARDGLPGEHYFHVEFRTEAPGVRLSQRMRERYPDKMTVVLQHQFWDLSVDEEAFEVGLSFGGAAERLRVPFASVMGFFDESVQFGLRFEIEGEASTARREHGAARREQAAKNRDPAMPQSGEDAAQDKARPAAKFTDKFTDKSADKSAGKPETAETAAGEDVVEGAKVLSIDAFRKKT